MRKTSIYQLIFVLAMMIFLSLPCKSNAQFFDVGTMMLLQTIKENEQMLNQLNKSIDDENAQKKKLDAEKASYEKSDGTAVAKQINAGNGRFRFLISSKVRRSLMAITKTNSSGYSIQIPLDSIFGYNYMTSDYFEPGDYICVRVKDTERLLYRARVPNKNSPGYQKFEELARKNDQTLDNLNNIKLQSEQIYINMMNNSPNTYNNTYSNSSSGSMMCYPCSGQGYCHSCGGKGVIPGLTKKCLQCHGTGVCPYCNGSGRK